jgi:hypothetical protein
MKYSKLKRMKKCKLLVGLLILIQYSCLDNFLYEKKVVDKYYLIAMDDLNDMSLNYKLDDGVYIGIVNEGLFEIGNNGIFIILKQHPIDHFSEKPLMDSTNFFIIQIDKSLSKYEVEENFIGPLNETEFLKERKELGIPQNIVFKEIN